MVSTINNATKEDLTKVLSNSLYLLQVKENKAATTGIQNFTFTTLQSDVIKIKQLDSSVAGNYTKDFFGYVATDQNLSVADVSVAITANNDSLELNEDSTIEIVWDDLYSNDVYLRGSDYTFAIESFPQNGSITNSEQIYTYTPSRDFNGTDVFTYKIEQGGQESTATVSIKVNPVNDAPVISDAISRKQTVDYGALSVGIFSASDVDEDVLTYSILGTDASLFSITSSGVLSFKNVVTDPRIYNITLQVSDGTMQSIQDLEITVNPNTPPEFTPAYTQITSPQQFYVPENQTYIGTMKAIDIDGDAITYSLDPAVFDNEYEDFELLIDSESGVLRFTSPPDYETRSTYPIVTIFASDGYFKISTYINISITDIDENGSSPVITNSAPAITSSATFSAAENQTSIGSVSATDADGDSLTYSISGSEINISSSGVLTFATAPDYETKTSYTATVTVSDGINSTTQNITVNVTDVAENVGPVISGLASSVSVAENQTSVISVSASDANGDTLSYSLSGTDAASFSINSSGVITFDAAPNYESKNSYSITVQVSDGSISPSQALTVNVTNVNEAPIAQSQPQGSNFSENSTGVVFRANSLDPDSSDTLSFSLTGDDAGDLNIDSNGDITFASDPNYELPTDANSNNTYEFNIVVTDAGGLSATSNSSINVTDVALASDTDPQTLNGTAGADSLQGGAGDDTLSGLGGDDLLDGGIGNDLLIGGDGDDRLIGGVGNDILWGGPGKDRLESGSGEDKFAIKSGEGSSNLDNVSWIENNAFEDGTDKVLLKSGLAFSDLTIVTATGGLSNDAREVSNGDYVISEANGGTKYLLIIKRSGSLTIDENDFVTE